MKKIAQILVASFIASTLIACGGNECESAADRLMSRMEECGFEPPQDSGDGNSQDGGECSEEAAAYANCVADCAEEADCSVVVVDTANPPDTDDVLAYAACVAEC